MEAIENEVPRTVKVKPLEWGDTPPSSGGSFHISRPPSGFTYFIKAKADSSCILYPSNHVPVGGIPCSDVEAAKAAAQADYERRILSALSDQPASGAAVAWRWSHVINGKAYPWVYIEVRPDWLENSNSFIVEPLCLHPAPPAITVERDEALAEVTRLKGELAKAAAPEYLVWSNEHCCWWAANRCGYASTLDRAGRYTRDEALKICVGARGGRRFNNNPSEVPVLYEDAVKFWPDDRPEWRSERFISQSKENSDAE